jgi:hypothetical protein
MLIAYGIPVCRRPFKAVRALLIRIAASTQAARGALEKLLDNLVEGGASRGAPLQLTAPGPCACQFFRRRYASRRDRWWLAATGKGDHEREVSATTEMMVEFTRSMHSRFLSRCRRDGRGRSGDGGIGKMRLNGRRGRSYIFNAIHIMLK